jgi:hypothetical protein
MSLDHGPSDLPDLLFLGGEDRFGLCDVLIRHLLDLGLGAVEVVLGYLVVLLERLELFVRITAGVSAA